jgi:hypothetical protein
MPIADKPAESSPGPRPPYQAQTTTAATANWKLLRSVTIFMMSVSKNTNAVIPSANP